MAHESDGAAAREKPALPAGYEDEAAFLAEARERYQQGLDADRENREAGLDDLRFLAGEQWDKAYEKARLEAGRPCLTINRLPQFVAQVIGDLRINRPGIKVRPAEDADQRLAQVREGLIRAIERESDAQSVYAAGDDGLIAEVLGLFRHQVEIWIRLLDPRGEAGAWRDGAHTLKGACLGVGAFELARLCGEAEQGEAAGPGEKAVMLEHIQNALAAVLADIAAYEHEQALKSLKTPR